MQSLDTRLFLNETFPLEVLSPKCFPSFTRLLFIQQTLLYGLEVSFVFIISIKNAGKLQMCSLVPHMQAKRGGFGEVFTLSGFSLFVSEN